MPDKETVFVTGGTGYIGSHCLIELINAGYEVITIDNMLNSRSASLKRVEEISGGKITFYICDLLDAPKLNKIFSKVNKFGVFEDIPSIGLLRNLIS